MSVCYPSLCVRVRAQALSWSSLASRCLVPGSVPSSLLLFLSPSPSLSLCLSLFFYFPENQFEERERGKKESARNPGINPGACTWCLCCLIAWSLPGPQSESRLQDPLTLPLPSSPGFPPPLPPVSLSHSRSTNWHQWPDLVVVALARGRGGQVGRAGLGEFKEGTPAWLGTTFLSPTGHWWRAHVGTGARHWCLLTQLVSTAPGFCTCLEAEGGGEGRRGTRKGRE